jgi:hypothetical protein
VRRRVEIAKAIDDRLAALEQHRKDLDRAAHAFCDLLADGSSMGRGVATQVINGIAMATPAFTDLLSHTRSYRERIRSGLEPLPATPTPAPAPAPAPAQRELTTSGDAHAA